MKSRLFAYSFSILFQLRYRFKQYLIRKSHYCIGMALSLYTTLCHTSLNFFLHKENFVCTGMKSTVNTFLYEFFVVQSRGDPIQALRGSLQSKLGRWVGGRMPGCEAFGQLEFWHRALSAYGILSIGILAYGILTMPLLAYSILAINVSWHIQIINTA